jgi:hypothetical protein
MTIEEITKQQNEGKPCPSCGSYSGHYHFCILLNSTALLRIPVVKPEFAATVLTEGDKIILHSLGVSW